ncbi:MAG: hypothetical protein AAFY02_20940 [Pseudomonadota bacterium]
MSRGEFDPAHPSKPSEAGLDFAEQIAKAMGMPYDRAQIAELAPRVYDAFYDDLVTLLERDPAQTIFRSGRYPEVRVFAASDSQSRPHVVLDEDFYFWVFGLGHVMTILAGQHLNRQQREKVDHLTIELFALLSSAQRSNRVRDIFAPFYFEYARWLRTSEPVGRAMMGFVLCHELAHIDLGHLGREPSRDLELEADRLAADYFMRVVEACKTKRTHHLIVDPRLAGAPILLMRLLKIYETWLEGRASGSIDDSRHPRAEERLALVADILTPMLTDGGQFYLNGLAEGLDKLAANLGQGKG